jgi:hypothetical protein
VQRDVQAGGGSACVGSGCLSARELGSKGARARKGGRAGRGERARGREDERTRGHRVAGPGTTTVSILELELELGCTVLYCRTTNWIVLVTADGHRSVSRVCALPLCVVCAGQDRTGLRTPYSVRILSFDLVCLPSSP